MSLFAELDWVDEPLEFEIEDVEAWKLVDQLSSDTALLDDIPKEKKKRFRKRAAHELCFLREQVTELTQKLESLQASQADIIKTSPSVWEERSKRQASQRKAVEHENQTLKSLLERQLKVTESLMKLVSKRPRLSEMTYLEKWKSRKLVRDPIERHKTLHAILDEKYGKLESVFIANRLLDVNENTTRTNVSYEEESKDLVFDFSLIEFDKFDYLDCAQAIWDLYETNCEYPFHSMKGIESIDSNSYQIELIIHLCKYGIDIHQHLACKRYFEEGRVVMVFESILDDDMFPFPEDGYVSRETSWLIVENVGVNRCKTIYHAHGHLPCKVSRIGDSIPHEKEIHTMSFAMHVLECYKWSLNFLTVQLQQKLGLYSNDGN